MRGLLLLVLSWLIPVMTDLSCVFIPGSGRLGLPGVLPTNPVRLILQPGSSDLLRLLSLLPGAGYPLCAHRGCSCVNRYTRILQRVILNQLSRASCGSWSWDCAFRSKFILFCIVSLNKVLFIRIPWVLQRSSSSKYSPVLSRLELNQLWIAHTLWAWPGRLHPAHCSAVPHTHLHLCHWHRSCGCCRHVLHGLSSSVLGLVVFLKYL